jgi:hypothetical protein
MLSTFALPVSVRCPAALFGPTLARSPGRCALMSSFHEKNMCTWGGRAGGHPGENLSTPAALLAGPCRHVPTKCHIIIPLAQALRFASLWQEHPAHCLAHAITAGSMALARLPRIYAR